MSDNCTATWRIAPARLQRASKVAAMVSAALVLFAGSASAQTATGGQGRNLFAEIGKTQAEIDQKLLSNYNAYFGGSSTIYYEVARSTESYILDTGNRDIRSEGMGYGMFITVQMNDKAKFDRLWTWAYNKMLHKTGNYQGYFCWHTNTRGTCLDQGPAPDGETYIAASLYLAASRWGNGSGIYNYQAQADAITNAMLNHEALVGGTPGGVVSEVNPSNYIVFAPIGDAATFTDPSYHTPHLFELFAHRASANQARWSQVAAVSRNFLASTPFLPKDASGQNTCLTPEYSEFGGAPKAVSYNSNSTRFFADAYRTVFHAAVDYEWWRGSTTQPTFSSCLLGFFASKADANHVYRARWELNGVPYGTDNRWTGLAGMNGGAVLAVPTPNAAQYAFVTDLWNMPSASGTYRYYDGLLHMFGLLASSNRYKAY
jgi:oligosaccharide reducing-end xylanase